MSRTHREGYYALMAGVCLSVCLYRAVPESKSRTEGLKFGRKEVHEFETSKVKVTRPINAVTEIDRQAYKLQTCYTDGVR